MALATVTLDDKYALESGRVFLTGIQALVRLPIMQRQRDAAAGLNTAGFISGFQGSPLNGVDQNLWRAEPFLVKHHIRFQPGLNEELGLTSVWGSQQVTLFEGARYDGVFALWYGKWAGVGRCGDVFNHGNSAGSARHGGVLLVAGDDHMARSSTVATQSEPMLTAAMIPVLSPAGVQDYLDLGIHGWAMSRYSGCWIGLKAIDETIESSASVHVDPHRITVRLPEDFVLPPDGLNIRLPDQPLQMERRIHEYRLRAAQAYARANRLDQTVFDSPRARLGIITAGKSYLDVRQALDHLGIDVRRAAEIGVRLHKVGMTWPLEPEGVRRFAEGLEEILVVEEKRPLLESQVKAQLYNWPEPRRPRVVGKFDDTAGGAPGREEWLLPAPGELTPELIARVIAGRIARFFGDERLRARLGVLEEKERAVARPALTQQLQGYLGDAGRVPYFCSGCPHNTSTRVPEGSHGMAGVGCHFMATYIFPGTKIFTHMGAEGVAWIGQAPFTDTPHVFANLGDGTYYHSGVLAIRAAVAAGVTMTYKILYNHVTAATGGQPFPGELTVPQLTRQLAAERVSRIVVVTDEPGKYGRDPGFAPGVAVRHRDDLEAVQRELREQKGVSALVYDQTCAAEKRRRRKRGLYPDPARRAFINEAVCEGCGDCNEKSNCLSVLPVETELGRKRAIDQSSCNKDFSCLKGLCPAYVTVEGGALRKGRAVAAPAEALVGLPEPALPSAAEPYGILVNGIGGTGVITIGALLGMAAHLEGKGVSVLDMTGVAQKGGAVMTHVRIADSPEALHSVRIAAGEGNAVIGCDIVVTVENASLSKMQAGVTRAVVNTAHIPTASFVHNPDLKFPIAAMARGICAAIGEDAADFLDATRLATALLGDSIATNLFMLGYAYQKGMIPVSGAAILKAIELNGVAVEANQASFLWGRLAAHDLAKVERIAVPAGAVPASQRLSEGLEEVIARRVDSLTAYQDAAYARRYAALVERARRAERDRVGRAGPLTEAVARYYFKLLAYKDEYEVARLHTDGELRRRVGEAFDGDWRLTFHLAPPLWSRPDPVTGEPRKRAYGPWIVPALRLLARLKGLRGTRFDVFGRTPERRMERQLIADYEHVVERLLAGLTEDNHEVAVEIAALPEHIRGFGQVKARHVAAAKRQEQALLERFAAGPRAAGSPGAGAEACPLGREVLASPVSPKAE